MLEYVAPFQTLVQKSPFPTEARRVQEYPDFCFEEELKRLEESVSDISKYSTVIKKDILDDGKSKQSESARKTQS